MIEILNSPVIRFDVYPTDPVKLNVQVPLEFRARLRLRNTSEDPVEVSISLELRSSHHEPIIRPEAEPLKVEGGQVFDGIFAFSEKLKFTTLGIVSEEASCVLTWQQVGEARTLAPTQVCPFFSVVA